MLNTRCAHVHVHIGELKLAAALDFLPNQTVSSGDQSKHKAPALSDEFDTSFEVSTNQSQSTFLM